MKPLPAAEKSLAPPSIDGGRVNAPGRGARLFRRADLQQGVELVGDRFRFSKRVDDDEPLLEGRTFEVQELQPGLVLHCAQVRDLQDFQTQVLQQPGIKLSLLVSGATQVAYGRHHYHLGPHARPGMHNQGALVSLSEPDTFQRQWRRGREERKISITLKPEWLEASGFGQFDEHAPLTEFAARHMAERPWLPSAQVILAAERILEPPVLLPGLRDLYVESRCLDIIVEALGIISGPVAQARLRPQDRKRLRKLMDLLDSGSADAWSLQRIANQVGSNPTSLQRLFQSHTGTTIFEYQRSRRMRQAHVALCRDMVSVEQAAAIAGYTSGANFATAFKRRYGLTPRQSRAAS